MSKRFENGLRKVVRGGLWALAGVSALFLLGTVGAIDAGHVGLAEGVVRCICSLGLAMFCFDLVN